MHEEGGQVNKITLYELNILPGWDRCRVNKQSVAGNWLQYKTTKNSNCGFLEQRQPQIRWGKAPTSIFKLWYWGTIYRYTPRNRSSAEENLIQWSHQIEDKDCLLRFIESHSSHNVCQLCNWVMGGDTLNKDKELDYWLATSDFHLCKHWPCDVDECFSLS